MLFIHTSNQLERLSQQFSAIVNTPLNDVFASEMVVVQNAGMARYLSMQISTISGISANTEYLFPAEFMWRLLRIASPEIPEKSQCTPDTLRFHIMQELTEQPEGYPELSHYILSHNNRNHDNSNSNKKTDELATWELAGQLANILDKTLYYRSEWVQKWESNPEEESSKNWQARLWIRCVTQKKLLHWLHLQEQFKASFTHLDTSQVQQLPQRISFFSMSSLSPGYLELIGEIAKMTDIHIYIINPCEDVYWGDIASEKSRSKLSLEKQTYVDIGNPLLASMGVQGRDFIEQLLTLTESAEHIERNPIPPLFNEHVTTEFSLLKQIQSDIYSLTVPKYLTQNGKLAEKGGRPFDSAQQDNAPDDNALNDNSIIFNACHTTMREVEVLHDQLLDALASDHNLAPSDILVMMPDVEVYAPYIESIFSSAIYRNNKPQPSRRRAHLPFSIADRDPLNVHQLIEALLKILQLADTQFDVESVFEILDYEVIHNTFNLSQDQVIQCRELARETNIRWGIDALSRSQNNYPNTDEHTWKYALERSLLGYALGESNDASCPQNLFESLSSPTLGLLAYNEVEGSDAIMLADFKHFTDVVFKINQWQQLKLTLPQWLEKLTAFIKQLFSMEQVASDIGIILKSIDELNSLNELTEFPHSVSFSLFQKIIKSQLQKIEGHEKFLGHGITFCALVPMRSVPFKVIALMGMNDGEYPRQDSASSFDAIAKQPRRGDRSRRDEDRYLFLESLLASRSRLIISYIGQSVKDNSDLPPSALVSELLDVIEIYTKEKPKNRICKHPLQAFSPKYFKHNASDQKTPPQLFSYANQYAEIQRQSNKSEDNNKEFFINLNQPLDVLDDNFKAISIEELIAFYQSPARAFLKTRFDIKTYGENITLEIREPFKIEKFKEVDIRDLVLNELYYSESNIESNTTADSHQIARAKGLLPYGDIGDAFFEKERKLVEHFIQNTPQDEILSSEFYSLELSTTAGDFILQGSINNLLDSQRRIVQQMGSLYAHGAIALWIPHLILNTQQATRTEFRSPEIGFILDAVNDAEKQLITLLENYWQGLHSPLPFFPKSAFAMFKTNESKQKNDKVKENLTTGVSRWNGGKYSSAEKEQFENWLLYRHCIISSRPPESESPINLQFKELSYILFGEFYTYYQVTE